MFNLYHLKYFIDAAEMSSLTKAAEKNLISTSAISQSIRQLENAFGCELIRHSQNRFSLTPEGQVLQRKGQQLLSSVDTLQGEVRFSQEEGAGPLLIATTNALAQMLVVPAIAKLCATFKKLDPKVKIGGTSYVFQTVEAGLADIGIAVEDGTPTTLKKVNIRKGQFRLFVSKKLGTRRWNKQKIWQTNFSFEALDFETQFLRKFKERPVWGFQLESWTLVSQVVESGLGVGILPDFMAEINSNIVPIEADFKMRRYDLNLYFRSGEEANRNAKLFLREMVGK